MQVAELGDQEGGEHEVEWQDVFNAVGHVERGVAGGLASSRTIGPEAEQCESGPLRCVAFTCLDQGLLNGAVLTLNNPVSYKKGGA